MKASEQVSEDGDSASDQEGDECTAADSYSGLDNSAEPYEESDQEQVS